MKNNQQLMNELNVLQKLYDSNKLLEAENKTNELIKKFPKLPNLYNFLGLIYKKKDEVDNAIKAFKKAIEIQSNFAFAFNNLGDIYKKKEKNDLAIKNYNKAIELDPTFPEPYNNLGNLYSKINKFTESIENFQKAIKINPKLFVVHHNLGMAYKSRGEFDKAKKSFLQAIKIKPDFFYSYRNLGLVVKWKKKDNNLAELKKKFLNLKKDRVLKRELAFTLGKAHADILNYEYAYKYFEEANRIQKANSSYSIDYDKKLFQQIESTFNKSILNKTNYSQNSVNNKITPIFIVGMPRSGTSLVEQILSNHSKIFACGEIELMNDLINKYFFDRDKNFLLKTINNHDKKTLIKIGNEYIENIKKISDGSFYVTDKNPFNFRWVGIIKLILPNAKVIHCSRESKDICMSIFKNFFSNKVMEFSTSIENIVEYFNLYKKLIIHWRNQFPDFIFNLKYEDLINNQESWIKKTLFYLNLNWENSCLEYYKSTRQVHTASDVQIRKPMYKDSISSWKKYQEFLPLEFNNLD